MTHQLRNTCACTITKLFLYNRAVCITCLIWDVTHFSEDLAKSVSRLLSLTLFLGSAGNCNEQIKVWLCVTGTKWWLRLLWRFNWIKHHLFSIFPVIMEKEIEAGEQVSASSSTCQSTSSPLISFGANSNYTPIVSGLLADWIQNWVPFVICSTHISRIVGVRVCVCVCVCVCVL